MPVFFCSAPMPYLIGIHSNLMTVRNLTLTIHVLRLFSSPGELLRSRAVCCRHRPLARTARFVTAGAINMKLCTHVWSFISLSAPCNVDVSHSDGPILLHFVAYVVLNLMYNLIPITMSSEKHFSMK
jgi:hypothetical protein